MQQQQYAGAHPDLFEQRDTLGRPFAGAVALHLGLIGCTLLFAWINRAERFGALNAGGQTVGVETVASIPIIHHGEPNPLTNDTQSEIPQEAVKPKDQVKEEVTPPDAIRLKQKKSEKKKVAKEESERHTFRPYRELEPNQITSKEAPQISNPMFAQAPGSGQIGLQNNTMGDQFAGYGAQVQTILTANWHTNDLDSHTRSAPLVEVTFEVGRDGRIRNVRMARTSGNLLLDNSVQRAVADSDSRLPPLPVQFRHDTASFDFTFELRR